MRFAAFLAGLALFVAPAAHLVQMWTFIDQVWRDDPGPMLTQVLGSTRFGLPLWAACSACMALGALLLYWGQHRPQEPLVRRRGAQTRREPIIRQLAR